MSDKNDGGPAFPTDGKNEYTVNPVVNNGMSLRDYFAAKAMQGFVKLRHNNETITRWAYDLADAMIKESQKS